MRDVLKMEPAPWEETFLRGPRGASVLALTMRQSARPPRRPAIAHTMVFRPSSLSVIACPAQRQSAEAIRRVKEALVMAGAALTSDNVYGLELKNGSRALALPGIDDSIRGMTVDGWIVADEAARLSHDMIAALRPMRATVRSTPRVSVFMVVEDRPGRSGVTALGRLGGISYIFFLFSLAKSRWLRLAEIRVDISLNIFLKFQPYWSTFLRYTPHRTLGSQTYAATGRGAHSGREP
jgi:hypothetical protein